MSFCLPLFDHVYTESLTDIALRRGISYGPKLNDTGLDRAVMVYSDHFSLYSLQSKENKIDETLLRIYFGNYKTLLTTRAGLHHRRVIFFRNVLIFLGSCPCSYSLLSTQTVSEPHSLEQSINLGGFFSLCQLNYTLPPNHSFEPSWENKTGSYSCFQLFANELVGRYHRLRCLFFRMLAHSRTVLMQQSLQIFLQPILFACQKLSKTIKRLEVASCSTIYGNSQLFNTGFLFLVPSTHGNNCCVYFHPEISKEFCLCLRSWPHPKKHIFAQHLCRADIFFLDHFSGQSQYLQSLVGSLYCLDLRSSPVLGARMAIPRNSRTFHTTSEDFWMISSVQFQCFDWIFPFNHVVLLLEFYVLELDCTNFKHYLARKCWTYTRRQGVLNSCCKGPLVI